MRAGNLDKIIRIDRFSSGEPNDYGTVQAGWSALASLRAQIIQQGTDEFIRAAGASDETVIIFRTRYLDGVTNADRVSYRGDFFDVKETKEIGRREGLEIRCLKVTTE